jgi:hypothetical protein
MEYMSHHSLNIVIKNDVSARRLITVTKFEDDCELRCKV